MHLLIISHKEAWLSNNSNYNVETTGGFPFQINAISTLFETSTLICCLRNHSKPDNLTLHLKGKSIHCTIARATFFWKIKTNFHFILVAFPTRKNS